MAPELWQIAAKIGLSALLAGAIGAEREWTGKAAGLRTHMLIAVGAALLTDVSVHIGPRFHGGSASWDPGRIAAQIVSGVGFLGAGTILRARGGVRGLTTAAGLWVAAAIGLAVGAGFFAEAAVTTAVLLLILVALRPVERRLLHRGRQVLAVQLPPGRTLGELGALLETAGVHTQMLRVREESGYHLVRLTFAGTQDDRHRLMDRLDDAGLRVVPGGRPSRLEHSSLEEED